MFESKVLGIPVVKVFVMTDENNHLFILSFHCSNHVSEIYFKVTPSRFNSVTKVPVYEGTCYTINTFMDMLTAYGCKYVRRLPIGKGEILSKDYLDGLADSSIIANPKTKTACCCNCNDESSEESSADFLERLIASLEEFEELNEDELPF